jgi:hypothetical protein
MSLRNYMNFCKCGSETIYYCNCEEINSIEGTECSKQLNESPNVPLVGDLKKKRKK